MLAGAIDEFTPNHAIGWVFDRNAEERLTVQAVLYDRVIGQAVADLYRPDLEHVGFGDGRFGFQIKFATPLDTSSLPFLSIRPEGTNLNIARPIEPHFLDLIRAVLPGYPAAGRTRSLLGGLWTDRTDALEVLAGRLAIGTCAAETQHLLRSLIDNGYVLTRGTNPGRVEQKDIATLQSIAMLQQDDEAEVNAIKAALAKLLPVVFEKNIVLLLQSVFDDYPVAYRLDPLTETTSSFAQLCSVEKFPSPAECMALYVNASQQPAIMEIVRNSHELPEFTARGQSRWTDTSSEGLMDLALAAGSSLTSIEIKPSESLVVGPGLIHRVNRSGDALLRVLCAPRRITPQRFLSGDRSWIEVAQESGARFRV